MISFLKKSLRGEALSRIDARACMRKILQGDPEARPEQIGAYLASLNFRTPNVEEIVGWVEAMRESAVRVERVTGDVIDICGTGGDGLQTFNISTTAAFVVAAAGCPVAKHGNRAVSSRSGSFDVLDALGVPYFADALQARQTLDKNRLAFFFAQDFYPGLKDLAVLRRSLGVRTLFNALGPLLNPAGVQRQLIGVYSEDLLDPIIHVLKELGATDAMVVHSNDGLDEFSISAPTHVRRLHRGEVSKLVVSAEALGLKTQSLDLIKGGDAAENAALLERVLRGDPGPHRDIVALNSAAALVVGGRTDDLREALKDAHAVLDNGQAHQLLLKMKTSAA